MPSALTNGLTGLIRRLRPRRRPLLLPPGDLIDIDIEELQDRQLLMDLAAQHGPIFKGRIEGQLAICIVGLSLGKRFLREHADDVQASSLDITRVVPAGFMRRMQGETHRHYRRMLMAALSSGGFVLESTAIRQIMAGRMRDYAAARDFSPEAWQRALYDTAARVMILVMLGFGPDTPTGRRLFEAFHRLGPHGLVWNLTDVQTDAFAHIRSILDAAMTSGSVPPVSLLGRLLAQSGFDDTLLGNLIYMTEMGRYDMQTFFRWLSRHGTVQREALRAATWAADTDIRPLRSFVLEVLRSDQSERLMRRCLRDVEFEGYRFPKDTTIRVCMWESHHDASRFVAPMRFQPDRFAREKPDPERFSPFGLDRHQCPFNELSTSLAAIFLEALAGFDSRPIGDGSAIRGAYHWEPPASFSVEIVEATA